MFHVKHRGPVARSVILPVKERQAVKSHSDLKAHRVRSTCKNVEQTKSTRPEAVFVLMYVAESAGLTCILVVLPLRPS